MKILVVEDEPSSRHILEAILPKWGYEVVSVTDGDDAVEKLLGEDAPRLVLLDWVMPGTDGLEVCRIVRQNQAAFPPYIILLTGRGGKQDIAVGLDNGADDYVVKP